MPASPKVTPEQVRAALRRARSQLGQRNFSPDGAIYRDFAEPLDLLERYAEQQIAEDGVELNPVVLKQSARIWRTVEDQLDAETIAGEQVLVRLLRLGPDETKPRVYRVTFKSLGAFEGTAEQTVDLVKVAGSILAQRKADALAEQRRIERDQARALPEPETLPAEAMPDPASRG